VLGSEVLMPRTSNPAVGSLSSRRIRTFSEAARFVDDAGFCMLFPVKSVPLPSLYYAVTRRNLFDDWIWDEYSEMVWGWKDELPRRRRAFYGKCLRGRGTLISARQLHNFMALFETAAEPGLHDPFYAAGRITEDARAVWQALEEHGPLATLELRHCCRMDAKAGNIRYKRAILDLQRLLIAVHCGTEQEIGAWPSARFDLTWRAFPAAAGLARETVPADARKNLAAAFAKQHPDATPAELARMFRWTRAETAAAWEAPKLGQARAAKAGGR
jgi:hypothetical protein